MYFNGPWDACKKIYATDGLRGIYFGQGSTLLREFHGYGCYFLCYELLVQRRMAKDHIERKVSEPEAGFDLWAKPCASRYAGHSRSRLTSLRCPSRLRSMARRSISPRCHQVEDPNRWSAIARRQAQIPRCSQLHPQNIRRSRSWRLLQGIRPNHYQITFRQWSHIRCI